MTRDEYVRAVKSAFVTAGNKAAMTFFVATFPILANPILNKIVSYFVGLVVEGIVVGAETQAFFQFIDFRVSAQGMELINAATKNKEAQEKGTPDEKAIAEKELIDSFRRFAKLAN